MKVIFTHIPKTGGTAAKNILFNKNYDKKEIEKYEGLTSMIFNGCKWSLLHGHAPYGIHKISLCYSNYTYFTFVRNPIYQCISYYKDSLRWYKIIKNKGVYPSHETKKRAVLANEKSIIKFYQKEENQNMQTRYLSGILGKRIGGRVNLNRGIVGRIVSFMAKNNIKKSYNIFGITGKMKESIQRMGNKMGWEYGEVEVVNPADTETGREVEGMNEENKEQIRALNSLDVELYDFAVDQFEKQN